MNSQTIAQRYIHRGAKNRKLSFVFAALTSLALTVSMPIQAQAQTYVKTIANFNPGHYITANRGLDARVKGLLEAPGSPFLGIQKVYTWAEIEPVEGGPLHLEEIRNDLSYLSSKGKFLVIQLQTKDFVADAGSTVYPAWLRTKRGSPRADGGFYNCYLVSEPSASHDMFTFKSLPVMWDPVAAYYIKRFYYRLGMALNTMPQAREALEAINLNETALAANQAELRQLATEGKVKPFDQEAFIANTVDCASTLNQTLPNTTVIQFLNHSGPWSPAPNLATNKVSEFADRLAAKGVGLGGPNLIPDFVPAANVQDTVYPALRRHIGRVILGVANQPREYHLYRGGDIRFLIQGIFNLGRKSDGSPATADSLNLNYIFWTKVPDNLDEVKAILNRPGSPWVHQRNRGLVGTPPASVRVYRP